jgi:hypothetical protein
MLTYLSQTADSISVEYTNMPAGAEIIFVNKTSGAKTPAQGSSLGAGNGTAAIAIPSLSAGDYYLLAQSSGGQYIAQTVPFYVN